MNERSTQPVRHIASLHSDVRELILSARWQAADAIRSTCARLAKVSLKSVKLPEMGAERLREEDKLTPDLVFRDPYVLDFLGLRDTYAERDLEAAILREMEAFILELGVGFAFLERQKRIMVDSDDH